ncbi:hypothetical protein D9M73_224260 [compost metagenome]
MAGGGGCQGAGADIADLHVTGGHGGDDFSAAIELAPVDLGFARLLIGAIGLGHLGRVDGGLVGDGEVRGLGAQGQAAKGQCRQQATGKQGRDHGVLLNGLGGRSWRPVHGTGVVLFWGPVVRWR